MNVGHQKSGISPSSSQNRSLGSQHSDNTGTAITTTITNDDQTDSSPSASGAHSRIRFLSSLLRPESTDPNSIASLADSDRPARSLLSSSAAYTAVTASITTDDDGDDALCHWMYDTFISSDPDFRLVVLSFIPVIVGIYFSRIHCQSSPPPPSIAGIEAVLLAIYSSETKSRAGKYVHISIPDLSQPSPYHDPTVSNINQNPNYQSQPTVIGLLSPPIEPETVIKSMKRATIISVILDFYYRQISKMPQCSKLDFCKLTADWAHQDCPCKSELYHKPDTAIISEEINTKETEIEGSVSEQMKNLEINEGNLNNVAAKGTRIPLPWELLQPILRILAHCLLAPSNGNDVKDAASNAIGCLYARSCHDLIPDAILATRGLIQLDNRAREVATAAASAAVNTVDNTPTES